MHRSHQRFSDQRASPARTDTDVFIVGGGPAGLAAAIAARQRGLSVILADGAAPPIDKPCGEGLMPETLCSLHTLGVHIPTDEGHPFRGISFTQEAPHSDAPAENQVFADFPSASGLGLRRTLLHRHLVARAVACGVQLLWQTPVLGIDTTGFAARNVHLSTESISARWIVGADGQGSRVRRWAALEKTRRIAKRHAMRQHFRIKPWSAYAQIFWGAHVQAYVTPIAPEEICIVVMSRDSAHAHFATALQGLPQLQSRLRHAEPFGRARGAISVMSSLQNVQRGNVALLGDASGGVDAITGEGLRLAFRQALALAGAMQAGNLTAYEQAHRRLARRPMLIGHTMLFLARHPQIRSRLLRTLERNPQLFARLLATHAGHATPAQLLTTTARLGWRLLAT